MPEEQEAEIRQGRRVVCLKQGPFDGKRGKVEDVWAGQALVHFRSTSICEPVEYFKAVGGS